MPKITALQSETSPTSDDFLAIVDNASGTTKKVTKADLLKGQALTNLNGGTTAGVLTTDASGNVAVSSTQTLTVPYNSGFSDQSFGPVIIRKRADIVYIHGAFSKSSAIAGNEVVFTLPQGYRPNIPAGTELDFLCASSGTNTVKIKITETGDFVVTSLSTSGLTYGIIPPLSFMCK